MRIDGVGVQFFGILIKNRPTCEYNPCVADDFIKALPEVRVVEDIVFLHWLVWRGYYISLGDVIGHVIDTGTNQTIPSVPRLILILGSW